MPTVLRMGADSMRVLLPETLDQALQMRASEPGALPIAGGTDLMVDWPLHFDLHQRPFLDLSGVEDLRSLVWGEGEWLRCSEWSINRVVRTVLSSCFFRVWRSAPRRGNGLPPSTSC